MEGKEKDSPVDIRRFDELITEYSKYTAWIEKAKEISAEFSKDVVEKVIKDYEGRCLALEQELAPMKGTIEKEMERLDEEREESLLKKENFTKELQEMRLRHMIGELADKEFDEKRSVIEKEVEALEGTIEGAVKDIGFYTELMEKTYMREEPEEEVIEIAKDEPKEGEEERFEGEDDIPEIEEEGEVGGSDEMEELPGGRGGEGGVTGEGMVEMDLVKELSIEDEAKDLEKELEEFSRQLKDEDIGKELEDFMEGPEEEGEKGMDEVEKRAQLLLRPGTPDQKIYPLFGESITIGRGRDNDILIKDDIKISRYHCKIFKSGEGFTLEDLRSSNGTFLNGEPVSKGPLKDGDTIIIGDTTFSFILK